MEEPTFEEKLGWISPISRCNIGCGFYGDTQWQEWDDAGEYVEYSDHEQIINLYKEEIARLHDKVSDVSQQAYEAGLMDGANQ